MSTSLVFGPMVQTIRVKRTLLLTSAKESTLSRKLRDSVAIFCAGNEIKSNQKNKNATYSSNAHSCFVGRFGVEEREIARTTAQMPVAVLICRPCRRSPTGIFPAARSRQSSKSSFVQHTFAGFLFGAQSNSGGLRLRGAFSCRSPVSPANNHLISGALCLIRFFRCRCHIVGHLTGNAFERRTCADEFDAEFDSKNLERSITLRCTHGGKR